MTAYELADKLDKGLMNYHIHKNLKDASTMLRQQAEQIKLLQNDIVKQQVFVCQQQAEIDALKLYKEKIETMERTYDNHFAQAMGNPKIKKASEK